MTTETTSPYHILEKLQHKIQMYNWCKLIMNNKQYYFHSPQVAWDHIPLTQFHALNTSQHEYLHSCYSISMSKTLVVFYFTKCLQKMIWGISQSRLFMMWTMWDYWVIAMDCESFQEMIANVK